MVCSTYISITKLAVCPQQPLPKLSHLSYVTDVTQMHSKRPRPMFYTILLLLQWTTAAWLLIQICLAALGGYVPQFLTVVLNLYTLLGVSVAVNIARASLRSGSCNNNREMAGYLQQHGAARK